MDELEQIRRQMIAEGVNPEPAEQTWTTDELVREFAVLGFQAPFVVVRRTSDGKLGSLKFRHEPRVYFGWQEDR
jgi:hypothetical protein